MDSPGETQVIYFYDEINGGGGGGAGVFKGLSDVHFVPLPPPSAHPARINITADGQGRRGVSVSAHTHTTHTHMHPPLGGSMRVA